MKSKKFLFGIVVVLLMMISVLPCCNEGQPTELLVIPSFASPYEVFNAIANAGPYIRVSPFPAQDIWVAGHMISEVMPQGALDEQFVEGYYAIPTELYYVKRDGEQAGCEETKPVLFIAILKYEGTESAKRSFINIGETQELQDSTYGDLVLKRGTYSLDEWEPGAWRESTVPCYLIHSGCFVIYFYGREDVDKDMLDRIIVTFGVKE